MADPLSPAPDEQQARAQQTMLEKLTAAELQVRDRTRQAMFAHLANDCRYHAPVGEQAAHYGRIRAAIETCGQDLIVCGVPSPELTIALQKLNEAMFWANASVARHPTALEHELKQQAAVPHQTTAPAAVAGAAP